MAELVAQASRALALDDMPGLVELLTENHALLAGLQVSTEKLDRSTSA
jgi:mevalonate kinase